MDFRHLRWWGRPGGLLLVFENMSVESNHYNILSIFRLKLMAKYLEYKKNG